MVAIPNKKTGRISTKKKLVIPVFMSLGAFMVNLIDNDKRDHLLYVEITLRLTDEETRKRLHDFMPEVRSRILLLLSHQKATEIVTEACKIHLMSEIKQALRPTFESELEESEQIITEYYSQRLFYDKSHEREFSFSFTNRW
ncbi:flagellar basal body-associated FliL family protein [Arsenophonus endosymbiont of Aleurodicus floccissimus]|uniref:flagellar basal body-associated FliL family protein n=1 Tax=Arsenophonus endosymbiont of Aleurodicus floccissimus TaxID=2152761 RepID=UPI001EDF32F2|nr:flagellar basal body-associated FliL family protein [Arsenophonus endosymbiont of Aleurodicus floccissimus]